MKTDLEFRIFNSYPLLIISPLFFTPSLPIRFLRWEITALDIQIVTRMSQNSTENSKRYYLIFAISLVAAIQVNAQPDKHMNAFIFKVMEQMIIKEKIGQLNLTVSCTFVSGKHRGGEMSPMGDICRDARLERIAGSNIFEC